MADSRSRKDIEAALKAYEDAGVDPRKDVDGFVVCEEDFWAGWAISDESAPDQLGAALRPLFTVCGDGLNGLASAYMLIGMRARAVWRPKAEREGPVTDIRHFKPLEEG